MPLEIPDATWPTAVDRKEVNRTEVINVHTDIQQHSAINAWRDVLRWEIASPSAGTNVSYELFPHCQHGVAVEFRVSVKTAAAGTLTYTVKSNGNTLGSTSTTTTALATSTISSAYNKLVSTDKITIDCALSGAGWANAVIELIIEPTTEVS